MTWRADHGKIFTMKPRILISSCLLGEPCRWHGRKCPRSSFVRKWLADHPEVVVIGACPEMLGGLTVPRKPVKRVRGRVYQTCPDKALRKEVTGKDVTRAFTKGAEETLAICKRNRVKTAILCQWSPSCDKGGITGRLLIANGIEVINTF